MTKIIQTYKQTRENSCGPSCILMAMHYFQPSSFQITQAKEHQIHDKIGSHDLEGNTMPSAICKYLLSQKLKVKYYYSRKEGSNVFLDAFLKRDESMRNDIKSIFYEKDFTIHHIKHELNVGKLVFVPINLGNEHNFILHWILLIGHQGLIFKSMVYADPMDGEIKLISEKKLNRLMNIVYVKAFISVGK
jgi:hypothetical protein